MEKIKNMWENLTLPSFLWWSIILWVPAVLLMLVVLPKSRTKFAMKQIRKLIRDMKNGKPSA
jgi:hypothetical protein